MMVMAGILVMVAIVNPFMLLTTAVCGVLMWLWTVVYLSTAQAIKRQVGGNKRARANFIITDISICIENIRRNTFSTGILMQQVQNYIV